MNLTISTHSKTWKSPKTRAAIGIGGVALALSIAIGGISALPSNSSREASITPPARGQPSTLFPSSADAVFALDSGVAISPQFANTVDAQEASIALAFAQPVSSTEARDNALGIGQPGERSASLQAELANIAAGEAAAYGVYDSQPVGAAFPAQDALGIGQPGERSVIAPQFATMADAVNAQEQILVALAEGGYMVSVPQFANMVDAWEASVR